MKEKHYGLSSDEVKERTKKGLCNKCDVLSGKTEKEIVITNTFTYFNLIFAVLTVLLCVVGSFRNLTFLPIIIGNTVVGIIQEIRAKRIVDKINILNSTKATVIREGKEEVIDSENLVVDDLCIMSAGEQIMADGILQSGSITVNESLLTGEADEIIKKEGDNLLSGSFVVAGKCVAKITEVGDTSYVNKLQKQAKEINNNEQSEMIKSINLIVKWFGIAIIPIGAILFWQGYMINQEGFRKAVISMVAAIIGMIPEGLYLLTTVALAVSTVKLAKNKVLLNDMKSIESLARVDVLCVDKTGTITENKMHVEGIKVIGEARNIFDKEMVMSLLRKYVALSPDNNDTMKAIREFVKDSDSTNDYSVNSDVNNNDSDSASVDNGDKQVIPFSSSIKYGAVTIQNDDEKFVMILGAAEFVLKERSKDYIEDIQKYTGCGYRVLLFAKYQGNIEEITEGIADESKVLPVAYVAISNQVRKNAAETFAYFKEQGVLIKVISGDNPQTVSEVARLAGIDGYESYVDATTLSDDAKIKDAALKYSVFGRVTPQQKQQIINSLKDQGHTVAMTGDGINDILAMKDSDCSVAMASGSTACCQVASVVLLDGDFSRMPKVVGEGRRVVNNIQRSAILFLVKNIFSLLMAVLSAVLLITYPLEPSNISLVAMFTIGTPGFLLALETSKERISGKFIVNVLKKAIPAALADVTMVGIIVICGELFGMPGEDIATSATLVLTYIGFKVLINVSRPFNLYKYFVVGLNVFGFVFACLFFRWLYALTILSTKDFVLTIVFALAADSIYIYLKYLVNRFFEYKNKKGIEKST